MSGNVEGLRNQCMKKSSAEAGYVFNNTNQFEKELSQTLLFQNAVQKSDLLFRSYTSKFLPLNPLGSITENIS